MEPFYTTGDIGEAAALATCQVKLLDTAHPITEILTTKGSDSSYHFETKNAGGMSTIALSAAYQDTDAVNVLDEAIGNLDISDQEKEELLQLAHYAAMSYIRVAMDNAKELQQAKTNRIRKIEKGGSFLMVPDGQASADLIRKSLAKFGG